MTRTTSRFISGENLGAVADWTFAAVDQASVRFAEKVKAQELAEEKVKESVAREAGFADGYAQGHAQATLQGQRQITDYIAEQGQEAVRHFAALFASAQQQIAESEQVMAKGVLELACELARQVLRHELSSNPNVLQPVIREALGLIAVDSKTAVVRMNPVDVDVFSDVLRQEYASLSLTLVSDASVARGGCLVEAAGTVVDGSVQKRWSRVVASLGLESAWEVADDVR
jgi:flagellar assembly protein FliH